LYRTLDDFNGDLIPKGGNMKRLMIVAVTIVLTLVFVTSGVEAQGPEMDPAQVIEDVYEAVMQNDLDTAGSYLAEDAVLVILPAPPDTNGTFVGKEAVLGWYQNLVENNITIEFRDAQVAGERVTITNNTIVDDLPIPVDFDGTAIVQDGKVTTMSWVMTPESQAALDATLEKIAAEEIVNRWLYLWDTVNGDLEGAEEILSDDFVSNNMPEGDRDAMIADIAAFREGNPGAYFPLDDLVVADSKAYVTNRMWMDGEPVSPPLILVLSLENGKITERTLFAPMQP
jgi:ketosteroid isomerase-like protein